jgi:hypothetical protein
MNKGQHELGALKEEGTDVQWSALCVPEAGDAECLAAQQSLIFQ